jgi:DNA polymerase III alpha subunit
MVITQDVHYLRKEDKEIHDVLMKIQEREPYEVENLSLVGQDYIIESFQKDHQYILSEDFNSALENTKMISDQVEDYNIPILQFEYPIFRQEKI